MAQVSWDIQGKDFFLLQTIFAAMTTVLDAYTDLLAERFAVPGREWRGTARTAATQARLPAYPGASAAHRNCSASLAGWIIRYFASASDRETGREFPPCSPREHAHDRKQLDGYREQGRCK